VQVVEGEGGDQPVDRAGPQPPAAGRRSPRPARAGGVGPEHPQRQVDGHRRPPAATMLRAAAPVPAPTSSTRRPDSGTGLAATSTLAPGGRRPAGRSLLPRRPVRL
jgi:hypothetical protein